MIKEKRRKQRLLKKMLIAVLVFMILIVIAVFVIVNVFVVKNVKIEGNKLYDEQLITDTVLNDEYSWNSLYVLLKYTFVDIKEVPFIDEMEVSLADPQTLHIKVYEKGMLGYLYISSIGENAYFDKDGFVVETSTRIIENVPKMEGINCDEVVLYEKLPIDNQKLRDTLTLTQALKREGLQPDSIHFNMEQAPVLFYGDTEVWLGSIELLTQKVARLKEILPSIKEIAGILHMESWTEETSNIIFEKKPEVPEADVEGDIEDGTESDTSPEDDSEAGSEDGSEDGSEGEGQPQDSEPGDQNQPETPQDDDGQDENQDEDVPN